MDGTDVVEPKRRPWLFVIVGGSVLALLAAAGAAIGLSTSTPARTQHAGTEVSHPGRTAPTPPPRVSPVPTTTSATTSTVPPVETTGSGSAFGKVTAIGDSVMLDYADPLRAEIPGVDVEATVSQQWAAGEALVRSLRAQSQLGTEVVIGLGTNGPITDADFDAMMSLLGDVAKVVFVNIHVDRPWQDPNNAVLARGAARYPNVAVADWASLAVQNPQWFGSDGTHLPIDGAGADALASLVAATLAGR